MKHRFFLSLLLSVLFVHAQAQNPGDNFDVTHYDIHLNHLDFTEKTIEAEAIVSLTTTAQTSTIVLELKSLTVSAVTSNEANIAQFAQESDLLTISLATPLASGVQAQFNIAYGGHTFNERWGGFHWNGEYAYNLGVGFESQPHNLGKSWFPCVDNFTDKASYDVFVTVENNKKAICGGNLVETTANGDGTSTWHWRAQQDIATYHISVAIGEYELWQDAYQSTFGNTIPIEVYAKPNQYAQVDGSFVNIKGIMAFFETCFGPYPFNRIGYVSTAQGCMEHIDNIALASSVINGSTSDEEFIAHELSHMWFGNKTTCATAADMWLNEGFAQFSGKFYRDSIYGAQDFQENMSDLIKTIVNWSKNPNNWIALNAIPLDMTYDAKAVYDRGAVIVNTMMNYMGRERFLEGMRHYLAQYSYGAASSEMLRDALTASSGIDMNGFFDTWVFTAGLPHFGIDRYEVVPNGNQYDVHIYTNYKHLGPSHIGQNNIYEIAFMDAARNIVTDTMHWDGKNGHSVKTIGFEPVAVFGDYYNKFADARLEQNYILSETGKKSFSNFEVQVENIGHDEFFRVESHLVGPDDDPELPSVTLSNSHYWTIWREDRDSTEVEGCFIYSSTFDSDIIHSRSDSAILLFRTDASEAWHTLPCSYYQGSSWKLGKIIVNDLPSGNYTIATIDLETFGFAEYNQPRLSVSPNPARHQVTVRWNTEKDGTVRINDVQGRLVTTLSFTRAKETVIPTSELPEGVYAIECREKNGQLIGTEKLIIQQ